MAVSIFFLVIYIIMIFGVVVFESVEAGVAYERAITLGLILSVGFHFEMRLNELLREWRLK